MNYRKTKKISKKKLNFLTVVALLLALFAWASWPTLRGERINPLIFLIIVFVIIALRVYIEIKSKNNKK